MSLLINVVIYQAVWFLCVFMGTAGALLSLALLAAHLVISKHRREDLQMMLALLVIGTVVDGTIRYAGLIIYRVDGVPIPFWLAMIWLALAILPHHSLRWLKNRPWLSALFAAVGGPLAYWAGVRVGSAAFGASLLPSLALLALVWALLWPLVMAIAGRILPAETTGLDAPQRRGGTGGKTAGSASRLSA